METSGIDHKETLRLNSDTVSNLLIQFIRDESQNAGFSKGVIGVSGGVDSALVAGLTSKALGKANTYGIILPYRTSDPQSVEDAEVVCKHFSIKSETIDISAMVDAYCEKHKISDKVRKGNVMARMRMIVLYDVSARDKALVIGTSNKTEIMLGYGTLYGDTASAINPIGDLYKTQVWQLAESLGVPKRVVEKKPSADLWAGQTDEGELGFAYRDVDRLLFEMIDQRYSDEELARNGFKKDFVRRVRSLVRKNQFKRRPPIIAKVSHRTLNVDFRYARDWGI